MDRQIKELISKRLEIPIEKLRDEESFKTLSLDSLDVADLIMEVEETYNIHLADDIPSDVTIGKLILYIKESTGYQKV